MIYRIRRNNRGQYQIGVTVFYERQNISIYLDFIFFHMAIEWRRN